MEKGYLYPAFAPITIFGSLGITKAGIKTIAASVAFAWKGLFGAKKLADAGFKPMGTAISLIHWDGKRHKAESRFIELLDEHHLRDMSKLTVGSKTFEWNLFMFLLSFLAIILSFTPYIYFIERSRSEPILLRWIFPIARSFGCLLITTMIQLVVQTRILQLVKYRIIFMSLDDAVKQAAKQGWITLPTSWDSQHPSEKAVYDLEKHLRNDDEPAGVEQQAESDLERQLRGHLLRVPRHHPLRTLQHLSLQIHHLLFITQNYVLRVFRYPLRHLRRLVRRTSPARDNDIEIADEGKEDMVCRGTEQQHERAKLRAALDGAMKAHLPSATKLRFRWTLLAAQFAIFIGIALSLAGYIGCFSLVQNSQTSVGPLIWLGCETSLSLLRLVIWSWNPKWDESTSMSLTLQLSPGRALSSCTQSTEELDESKKLPLTRAREFLNSVTACVGLVAPFDGDTGAVHYTLSASLVTGVKTLYATIYDYKENLTRIVIRRPSVLVGREPKIDFHVATLNNDHDEATIGDTVAEKDKDEFVAEHPDFFTNFERHCDSILRDGSSDREVTVELLWDVRSTEEEEEHVAKDPISEHDKQYMSVGLMEKKKAELDVMRAIWVERYIGAVTREEHLWLHEGVGSKQLFATLESAVAEVLLLHEWWEMEKMLMDGSRRMQKIVCERNESLQSYFARERPNDVLSTLR